MSPFPYSIVYDILLEAYSTFLHKSLRTDLLLNKYTIEIIKIKRKYREPAKKYIFIGWENQAGSGLGVKGPATKKELLFFEKKDEKKNPQIIFKKLNWPSQAFLAASLTPTHILLTSINQGNVIYYIIIIVYFNYYNSILPLVRQAKNTIS